MNADTGYMNKPHKHVTWKKPNSKDHVLVRFHLYETLRYNKFIETEGLG